MATKAQAKAAIDSAAVDAKSDIDNILPAGVDISGGGCSISFGPTQYVIQLNAGGNSATATSWLTSIKTNLTNANRPWSEFKSDRRAGDVGRKMMGVNEVSGKLSVVIVNF